MASVTLLSVEFDNIKVEHNLSIWSIARFQIFHSIKNNS